MNKNSFQFQPGLILGLTIFVVAATAISICSPATCAALNAAGQGKGGEVIAKPTVTPAKKKPTAKKSTPAETRVNRGVLKTVTLPMPPAEEWQKYGLPPPGDGARAEVQVMIDESGKVTAVQPGDGHPALMGPAVSDATQQHFAPATLNGQPAKSVGWIDYVFTNHPDKSTPSTTGSSGIRVPPPCTPAPSGMVSWYSAENNANDVAGSNHGTMIQGATFAPGKFGQAFSFNGIDQYVSVPSTPSFYAGAFTIAGWVNFSSLKNGAVVVSKYDGNWHGWILQSFDGGIFQFQVERDTNVQKAASGGAGPFAPNTWIHIAGTFDGTNITLYVNGLVVGTATFAGGYTPAFSTPLTIGKASWADRDYLPGKIDEVQFFNRALSASEMATVANPGVSMCHIIIQ